MKTLKQAYEQNNFTPCVGDKIETSSGIIRLRTIDGDYFKITEDAYWRRFSEYEVGNNFTISSYKNGDQLQIDNTTRLRHSLSEFFKYGTFTELAETILQVIRLEIEAKK